MNIIFDLDVEEKNEHDCKGIFFKIVDNSFISGRGDIVYKRTFRLMKRKSCPGCSKCSWLYDDISERGVNGIIGSMDNDHGDIVSLKVGGVSYDWETGYADDWDLIFEKVNHE